VAYFFFGHPVYYKGAPYHVEKWYGFGYVYRIGYGASVSSCPRCLSPRNDRYFPTQSQTTSQSCCKSANVVIRRYASL